MTETFRLALRAVNLGRAVSGLDDWLGQVETRAREAVSAGARLLLMPEYASEAWLGFKPAGLPPTGEIAWLAGVAEAAPIEGICRRSKSLLVAGRTRRRQQRRQFAFHLR